MVARDPAERSMISRVGAAASWAATPDPAARTAPARQAAVDRFRRQIDAEYPDVPEVRRADMAEHARKAYFLKLALKSAQARRARSGRAPSSTKDSAVDAA